MMSVDIRNSDRRRYVSELQAREKEIAAGLLKSCQPGSPKVQQETEKRIRREIANSNERRRMQCINAGFSNLKALIPQLEGEKLSKAAILQHATEYISTMEKDKTRLQMQLDHTKRMLSQLGQDRLVTDTLVSNSPPPPKRKKRDTESSDEGVGSLSDASDEGGSDLQNENVTLRHQLEIEKQKCARLEEHIFAMENQFLAVLQAHHPGTYKDHNIVGHLKERGTLYREKVVETAESQAMVVSSRIENIQHVRPMSPEPDEGIPMDTMLPVDVSIRRSDNVLTRFCAFNGELLSAPVKVEIITAPRETNTPSVSSAVLTTLTETMSTTTASSTDQQNTHQHNYCHRDHPRRRHRQQAILEQQRLEEELRRQQEQQDVAAAASSLYRPRHNTQNLENLVEAIRQIEGDRILCGDRKISEEKIHDQTPKDNEREARSFWEEAEHKPENSGRDSPPWHHLQQVTSPPPTTSTSSVSPRSSSSCNYSEKYPIASQLLHRPLQPFFYRPGVIVHKH